MPNYEEEVSGVEYQVSREEYIKTKMKELKHQYFQIGCVKFMLLNED